MKYFSKSIAIALLSFLPLLTAPRLCAQEEEMEVRYVATHVAGPVHMIHIPGEPLYDNIVASVGPDGILMVDDGFEETVDNVRALLDNFGGGLRFIINTHFHHAGANDAFGPEATVIAHENVRARMQRKTKMYGTMPIGPWSEDGLPEVTFDSTLSVHFNGEEVSILHFPNVHTDGDAVVFFTQSNVVATGDLFVPMLGVCDHANGGDWHRYVEGVGRLLDLIPPDAKIVPGHGPLSTYDDLQAAHQMLMEMTTHVQQRIDAGESLESIKAEGLPERWQPWAERGIDADFFLTNVYEGLARE